MAQPTLLMSVNTIKVTLIFIFFFNFDLGFTVLSRIFHIKPIIHQRWAKTGEPREKPPDHP